MLQKFVNKFKEKEAEIRAEFSKAHPSSYEDIVDIVLRHIYDAEEPTRLDCSNITVINHGDYQGTLLFVICQRISGSPSRNLLRSATWYQHDWTGWIEFFLTAIAEQAQTNTVRVRGILDLYAEMKVRIAELTRSQHALKVLDALFDRPIFESSDFVKRSGIPKQTASRFLTALRNAGILHVLRPGVGSQSAVFAFRELLNCAEGRKVL
jgi:hypothetical protein